MLTISQRFAQAISAVCPIVSVSIGSTGSLQTYTFIPTPAATAEQIAAANIARDSFDISAEAHATWEANRNPEKRGLQALAASHIADLDLIINAVSFTNAQRDAALKKLAQGQKAIVKRLVQLQ